MARSTVSLAGLYSLLRAPRAPFAARISAPLHGDEANSTVRTRPRQVLGPAALPGQDAEGITRAARPRSRTSERTSAPPRGAVRRSSASAGGSESRRAAAGSNRGTSRERAPIQAVGGVASRRGRRLLLWPRSERGACDPYVRGALQPRSRQWANAGRSSRAGCARNRTCYDHTAWPSAQASRRGWIRKAPGRPRTDARAVPW